MSDGSSPQPLPALAPGGAADPAPAPWALLAPTQRDDPQADTAQADTAPAEPAQVDTAPAEPAQGDTWSDPSLLPRQLLQKLHRFQIKLYHALQVLPNLLEHLSRNPYEHQ